MNEETNVRVMKTDDYDIFKFVASNRAVSMVQVNRIIESIKKVGVIPSPIIVNERMEVLDGQHRLTALKTLGEPVYYLKIDGIGMPEAVQMNAINAKWRQTDYINHYATIGLPDYVFLKKMLGEFKQLPNCVVIGVMCKNKSTKISNTDALASGTFKLVGGETEAVETLKFLASFAPTIKEAKKGRKSNFYLALAWIYQNKGLFELDIPQLHKAVKRICMYDHAITATDDYMAAIQSEYNFNYPKKRNQFFGNRFKEQKALCA